MASPDLLRVLAHHKACLTLNIPTPEMTISWREAEAIAADLREWDASWASMASDLEVMVGHKRELPSWSITDPKQLEGAMLFGVTLHVEAKK